MNNLTHEDLRQIVAITLSVQARLNEICGGELPQGRAAYLAVWALAGPEADRIGDEIVEQSQKRAYQREAKKWLREQDLGRRIKKGSHRKESK